MRKNLKFSNRKVSNFAPFIRENILKFITDIGRKKDKNVSKVSNFPGTFQLKLMVKLLKARHPPFICGTFE